MAVVAEEVLHTDPGSIFLFWSIRQATSGQPLFILIVHYDYALIFIVNNIIGILVIFLVFRNYPGHLYIAKDFNIISLVVRCHFIRNGIPGKNLSFLPSGFKASLPCGRRFFKGDRSSCLFLKATNITAINGSIKRNFTMCTPALFILFIMAIRFLSEEKLNFGAILN